MIHIIRDMLQDMIDRIDTGNSNITEEEEMRIIDLLREVNTEKLSKYQACRFLNLGRSRFDDLVRLKRIPEGRKQQGFKEKFWYKKDLQDYMDRLKIKNK